MIKRVTGGRKISGIYKITYTVKTSTGVGSKTISIVVDDKEKPNLVTTSEFENPKTISVNDSIDLLKGISCTDNSGKCKIRIDGTVNAKKVGTYNIKYIALDDAGNKSEPVYRVVKVN